MKTENFSFWSSLSFHSSEMILEGLDDTRFASYRRIWLSSTIDHCFSRALLLTLLKVWSHPFAFQASQKLVSITQFVGCHESYLLFCQSLSRRALNYLFQELHRSANDDKFRVYGLGAHHKLNSKMLNQKLEQRFQSEKNHLEY